MAIKFKLIPKKIPTRDKIVKKYFAVAVSNQIIDMDNLAKLLEANSTVSKADAVAVITSMGEVIPDLLKNGYGVELPSFCSFLPSVKSKGVDDPSDFNIHRDIKQISIDVRAKKNLKDLVSKASLEQIK